MKYMGLYLAEDLLDHLFSGYAYEPSLTIGIALSRVNPGVYGASLDEPPEVAGYARVATYASWWTWSVSNKLIYNSTEIAFPEATDSWGTITHYALYDSYLYGSGTMLFYGALLGGPTAVTIGQVAKFFLSTLLVTMG